MRLPNGYGGVVKLSGQRRRPYQARITIGYNGKNPKYKSLGYFETREDALGALAEYRKDPTLFSESNLTFEDIYNAWSEQKYKELSPHTIKQYKCSYRKFERLKPLKFNAIRAVNIEDCVRDVRPSSKDDCKKLLSQLYDYAIRHEIVSKDYSAIADYGKDKTVKTERVLYTIDEIKKIWQCKDDMMAAYILIGLYTGFRPGEVRIIKKANVNDGIITCGIKTDAGKDRRVPIHPDIQGLVDDLMKLPGDNLIQRDGKEIGNEMMFYHLRRFLDALGMQQHKPHDMRHTFATNAMRSGMDPMVVKKIMGHAISDITAGIYTHYNDEMLKDEMMKYRLF